MNNDIRRHKAVAMWSAGLLAVALCVAGCGPQRDVALARRVFVLLAEGRYTARNLIDWENFTALEQPVGRQWSAYTGEQDRLNFQRSFIDAFHSGFQVEHGKIANFTNWRVYQATKTFTTVAADVKGPKTFVFFFGIEHAKGKRKLVSIQAAVITDEAAFREGEKKARDAQ